MDEVHGSRCNNYSSPSLPRRTPPAPSLTHQASTTPPPYIHPAYLLPPPPHSRAHHRPTRRLSDVESVIFGALHLSTIPVTSNQARTADCSPLHTHRTAVEEILQAPLLPIRYVKVTLFHSQQSHFTLFYMRKYDRGRTIFANSS